MKTAILVAIGDELLSGIRREGNCAYLAWLLHDAGWKVLNIKIISDDLNQIVDMLNCYVGKTDLLVLSGGLGPTHDDKTRYALAKYLDCELTVNNLLYDRITVRYKNSSLFEPVERSRSIQGLIPDKAAGIYNPVGSALGIYFEKNGTKVLSFPGVPFEYKAMVKQEVLSIISISPNISQTISSINNNTWTWKSISILDIPESLLVQKIPEIISDSRLHISILPSFGLTELVLRGEKELIDHAVQEIRLKFIENVLPDNCSILSEAILFEGKNKNLTLSCAESCTGGAIGASLTELAGISEIFMGSAVVYANNAKKKILGVKQDILDAHGAVSKECAESMAKGALELYGTSLSVAVTGVAGPSGGSAKNPVGTVWFAVASQVNNKVNDKNDKINKIGEKAWDKVGDKVEYKTECFSECFSFIKHLGDERGLIRERTVRTALNAVWRKMVKMPANIS